MGESYSMNDDQVLVDRARKGDLDAFDALVGRHQAGLVRYLTMMLSRPADAEDVAQEALLRAYRALKDFRGQSAFRTWLYQIAGNAARTHLDRRRTRQEDQPGDDEVFDVPSGESLERRLEAQDAVRWALAQLPDEWREAVVLRDMEGFDYKEIAESLGIPMGTVESRIFRGRQRLRELLTGQGARR
jgi:RNA polymerase sigma-70 factor (ECF subfamily)